MIAAWTAERSVEVGGNAELSAKDEKATWFATKSLEVVKQAASATVAQ